MNDGFVKVAAAGFEISLADLKTNTQKLKELLDLGDKRSVNLIVTPELSLTGYTCGDLFNSQSLLEGAQKALAELADYSLGKYPLMTVGLPLKYKGRLYNVAALLHDGEILGIVPKVFSKNRGQFSGRNYFAAAHDLKDGEISLVGQNIPFGNNLIFSHQSLENYSLAIEIGADTFEPLAPAARLAAGGALIIANPAALSEFIGTAQSRRMLVGSAAIRNICAYVHSGAGQGESTGDLVFAGHKMIVEYAKLLAENKPFKKEDFLIGLIDTDLLAAERLKTGFEVTEEGFKKIRFNQKKNELDLKGRYSKTPFVPKSKKERAQRAKLVLDIQAHALAKRIKHTGSEKLLIGISGGLDSTMALLAAVKAMELMGRPNRDILTLTMPCFGTSQRTLDNAQKLCRLLGTDFKKIDITAAVLQHFKDIGQGENVHDITFENSQARERTQVLMDMANKLNGMVLGTGDLSELALGWATYNGDHMSMYAINTGLPKTLMREIVSFVADESESDLARVLRDIVATPVSPELLPAKEGELTQVTEEYIGPYELHDFYLYYMLRHGFGPAKIFRLAQAAFEGQYSDDIIKKWLEVFVRRFFSQQFKRSCLPDGPKLGSVNLSPRVSWHMPSDAHATLWLDEIKNLP
ncbi:MAG: NAD(+) synthase [Clostridiales bacterium]|nr:NAD(+) synthase [Clostridiales bacterium]